MATTEEILRRVKEADTARSAKRSTAARTVGELAQQRAVLAEQLATIERQLGEELVAAKKVMDVDELSRFTDIPAADLTRWLAARRTTRTKRPRSAGGALPGQSQLGRGSSAARPSTAGVAAAATESAGPHTDASARIASEVA